MATAASRETRVWEDLRKQARKHEGELDVKLAAYGKLCSSFDGGRGRGSGSTADQVTNKVWPISRTGMWASVCPGKVCKSSQDSMSGSSIGKEHSWCETVYG
eukprot:GHUV01005695.1.p2 GENE.GHUV01005695.1~~GHUV01005695.1.p2  ORF type:complete len:102 (+),score=10.34 GHUV01005695.1:288-593(+)